MVDGRAFAWTWLATQREWIRSPFHQFDDLTGTVIAGLLGDRLIPGSWRFAAWTLQDATERLEIGTRAPFREEFRRVHGRQLLGYRRGDELVDANCS